MSGKLKRIFPGIYRPEAIRDLDDKGRITIPKKIRKATRYMISYNGKNILLEARK